MHFKVSTSKTIFRRIISMGEDGRIKIREFMYNIPEKASTKTDAWSLESFQGYMEFNVHFIDSE